MTTQVFTPELVNEAKKLANDGKKRIRELEIKVNQLEDALRRGQFILSWGEN